MKVYVVMHSESFGENTYVCGVYKTEKAANLAALSLEEEETYADSSYFVVEYELNE